jgi:GTPase
MIQKPKHKSGTVALIGRPNAGKSTLLNMLIGQKVSITSPKPQTTRFAIQAIFEDDRGQILFLDMPGMFAQSKDTLSKFINKRVEEAAKGAIDVVLYVIDHTRTRDVEENKAFGLVRSIEAQKILIYNKIDIIKPTHRIQYKFMEEEMDAVLEVSALTGKHIVSVIDTIFQFLPERPPIVSDTKELVHPAINVDSKLFISELIREKAFLFLRHEIPYSLTAVVDLIEERQNGTKYIQARILTNSDHYKGMIVGNKGMMIKEISMATRKELETATGSHVYVDLTVEVDPHWMEYI